MRLRFQFMRQRKLRESLLHAEVEARLRGPVQEPDEVESQLSAMAKPSLSEEEEIRYRRLMAMLHYGENTANPEHEALLTDGEKEYLDGYLIHQRWAKFWLERNRERSSSDLETRR